MTTGCLGDIVHSSPLFGDRHALRSALGELSTGWPAIVVLGEHTSLVLPWDAVGYGDGRRLVDMPLTRAIDYPADTHLDRVLASMGDAEFVVVRKADKPVGVASRRAIVEAVADRLRAATSPSTPVQEVVEQLPEGVVVLDADRRVVHVNGSGTQILQSLAGCGLGERLTHLGGVEVGTLLEDARIGTPRDVITEPPCQHIFSVRTLRPSSSHSHIVLILRDVTHVRHRQAREATQERMALLGQLAGSIAHDFNNVLTIILGQTSLLQDKLGSKTSEAHALEAIQDASQRASKLVRQLLAFSRRELVDPVLLDTRAMLVELESLMERLVGSQVKVVLNVSPDLWPISADPVQLERVIANLVVNARDAMPEGGTVTIEADNVEACTCFPGLESPVRGVRIRVSDTGDGMDSVTVGRVFEPYFTTRPGKGTGIGLATVHATISALGGRVTVESKLSQGTTFEVLLRAAQEGSSQMPRCPPRLPGRRGRILLVEDEPALLDVVLKVLLHAGYDVVTARDVAGALEVFRTEGEPDLLLTDVGLGRSRSGIELGRQLRTLCPGVRVLFMSGYAQEVLLAEAQHPSVEFIAKPFGGEELLQRVARLVGVPEECSS